MHPKHWGLCRILKLLRLLSSALPNHLQVVSQRCLVRLGLA